jgi:uncharacterized Ntn-hydrolase superfamily protein
MRRAFLLSAAVLALAAAAFRPLAAAPPGPSTFSIAAADPATGEVGVAVASRFFAVGTVVPWAKAGVGAVATQASANTSFGPNGLDLMARGLSADEALKVLLRGDEGRDRRQAGLVTASGDSATYSGPGCNSWAGGRRGKDYAVQGNILVGEAVVAAMEKSFLGSAGKPLAERLLAALSAGDAAGGDSRGRQSAALLVCRAKGGYNGFTDRAVDVRVDDHADPFRELTRLVGMAVVNDLWNRGWTGFMEKRYAEALKWQEEATARAEAQPAMLPEVVYDLAVIRLAAGNRAGAVEAARRALKLNPKLAAQAKSDPDLEAIRGELP